MRKLLFIPAVLWIIISLRSDLYAEAQLVIGYNADLVPSFYWSESGNRGIDAEIIAELFHRSGLGYKIHFIPWARVMAETRKGVIDAACPGFRTPEREESAVFLERPLNYAVFSIFVRRGDEFEFGSLDDLHGKTVGINRGYSISPDIGRPEHRGKIRLSEANSAESNLLKLIAGRIDAYAGNRDAALFVAEKTGISDRISLLPNPVTEPRPVYLMLSKAADIENRETVIQTLNQKLDDMWNDGTIENTVSRHIRLKSFLNK